MMIALIRYLAQQLDFTKQHFAKSPLSPTLSRLRARGLKLGHIGALVQNTAFFRLLTEWLKPRIAAIIPSPAGGRGCATAWERGNLPIAKRLYHAK
jgi:hypothetical protein